MEPRKFAGGRMSQQTPVSLLTPAGRMINYQMDNDRSTALNCRHLAPRAEREHHQALTTALHLVAVDKSAHHRFFYKGVQLDLLYDTAATMDDLLHTLQTVAMPAND